MIYKNRESQPIFATGARIGSIRKASSAGATIGSAAAIAEDQQLGTLRRKSDQNRVVTKLMGANALIGGDVHNVQSEHLGSIKELVLNIHTGTIEYAVLSFGIRFTTPEKLFAIPWNLLAPDAKAKRFVLNVEKSRLKEAPGFDRNSELDRPDQSWLEDIRSVFVERQVNGHRGRKRNWSQPAVLHRNWNRSKSRKISIR